MRIARSFIDDLIAQADIVELINSYVPLRKAGRNFVACCPFHQEKTPSFSVNAEKQFYYCFGCGAGGNALSFVMAYSNLPFIEAIEELASRLGIGVEYEEGQAPSQSATARASEEVSLYDLLQQVAQFYASQLNSRTAEPARHYLQQRGINTEMIQQFQLGFAPDAWDSVSKHFGSDAQQQQLLMSAGLLVENEQHRRYDRFRNRLMFPIQDQRGRVIAFGGRVLDDSKPKYLNSPETTLFHKGRELYGWYQARQNRALTDIIIVEGYLDVIALAQFDLNYAVATLGTSTSEEHLKRLLRAVDNITFCFDGDEAGYKAAWRALESCLSLMQAGRQIQFALLPDGDDPDSFIRRVGVDSFKIYLQQAKPLSRFLFDHLLKQVNIGSLDGRARLVELAKPLLSRLPEGTYQTLMLQKLNELTQVDLQKLSTLIHERQTVIAANAPSQRASRNVFTKQSNGNILQLGLVQRSAVQTAIMLLLHYPELATKAEDIYSHVSALIEKDPDAELLMLLIEILNHTPHIHLGTLCEYWRGTGYDSLIMQLAVQEPLLQISQTDIEAEFLGVLAQIKKQYAKYRYDILLTKSMITHLSPSEKQELAQLGPLLSRLKH